MYISVHRIHSFLHESWETAVLATASFRTFQKWHLCSPKIATAVTASVLATLREKQTKIGHRSFSEHRQHKKRSYLHFGTKQIEGQ